MNLGCPYCKAEVNPTMKAWLEHVNLFCPESQNRLVAVARRYNDLAESIAKPQPLLDRVWEQIDDILVEQGFVL